MGQSAASMLRALQLANKTNAKQTKRTIADLLAV
jgi:hypothetical protein